MPPPGPGYGPPAPGGYGYAQSGYAGQQPGYGPSSQPWGPPPQQYGGALYPPQQYGPPRQEYVVPQGGRLLGGLGSEEPKKHAGLGTALLAGGGGLIGGAYA